MLYNDTTNESVDDAYALFGKEMNKKFLATLKKKKWRIIIPSQTIYEMTEDVAGRKWYLDNKNYK